MNAGAEPNHPTIYYYDSDYPSPLTSVCPENCDEVTVGQGVAYDVARHREIVRAAGGPVLELCCGTGRIAIPLARDGYQVTAVDVAPGMLRQFEANLRREDGAVAARVD